MNTPELDELYNEMDYGEPELDEDEAVMLHTYPFNISTDKLREALNALPNRKHQSIHLLESALSKYNQGLLASGERKETLFLEAFLLQQQASQSNDTASESIRHISMVLCIALLRALHNHEYAVGVLFVALETLKQGSPLLSSMDLDLRVLLIDSLMHAQRLPQATVLIGQVLAPYERTPKALFVEAALYFLHARNILDNTDHLLAVQKQWHDALAAVEATTEEYAQSLKVRILLNLAATAEALEEWSEAEDWYQKALVFAADNYIDASTRLLISYALNKCSRKQQKGDQVIEDLLLAQVLSVDLLACHPSIVC